MADNSIFRAGINSDTSFNGSNGQNTTVGGDMDRDERYARQEQAWKTLDAMNEKVEGLYDALYIGNGKSSVMVRLDRLEQRGRIIWGAFIAVIGKVLHNSVG